MIKNYLLTPGPTPIPPEVLLSMAQPIIHHRTPQYEAIFSEMNENLKYVFSTQNDIFTFAASGTGAMEAAVVNALSGDDTALVVEAGKFGERWREICRAYGVTVKSIVVPAGEAVMPGQVQEALAKDAAIKAVFVTLCETSTGAAADIKGIGEAIKNTPAILIVDAISGLAGMELLTDAWGLDLVVAGSQKGLMTPPGLSFCSVSKKAWEKINKSNLPKYYFDFKSAKKNLDKKTTPFTPAINLVIALNHALVMIKKEGLENLIQRHKRLARACRAAIEALGLELFAKYPADVVTAVKVPQGVDGGKLVKTMRDKYGISIAGGQAELKGKIFRIAQMGYMNEFDIIVAISCLEIVLREMGCKVELGRGVKAAEEVFSKQ